MPERPVRRWGIAAASAAGTVAGSGDFVVRRGPSDPFPAILPGRRGGPTADPTTLPNPDMPMKTFSLLLLRISLGWLMVVWGVDKLTNPDHGQAVAESFYLGIGSGATFLTLAGSVQVSLGLLVVVGWLRRFTWPVLALVNGITLLAVWKSVVDPWGFVLEGGNLVFYSSAVIFAGILVGWSHMDDDELALDARSGS